MVPVNRYGLSRDIPRDVARLVRQQSGFGCVACGNAFYQYHHHDPLFSEARKHRASGIVLLCGGCHDLVTRKRLSGETIRRHANNPTSLSEGFSWGPFDSGGDHPEIVLGQIRATRTPTLIRIDDQPILGADPPEEEGGPFRLRALMTNATEREILRIENNEWKNPADNWDVEVRAQRITVRSAPRRIALRLRHEPPRRLIVEELDMAFHGVRLRCSEGQHLQITSPGGTRVVAEDWTLTGCAVGVDIRGQDWRIGVGCESLQMGFAQFGG